MCHSILKLIHLLVQIIYIIYFIYWHFSFIYMYNVCLTFIGMITHKYWESIFEFKNRYILQLKLNTVRAIDIYRYRFIIIGISCNWLKLRNHISTLAFFRQQYLVQLCFIAMLVELCMLERDHHKSLFEIIVTVLFCKFPQNICSTY